MAVAFSLSKIQAAPVFFLILLSNVLLFGKMWFNILKNCVDLKMEIPLRINLELTIKFSIFEPTAILRSFV